MIDELRARIGANQFEFTRHAVDQSILRGISVQEMREVFVNGEVIEDYPEDKYGPSCLVFGLTESHRPLHIQCSHPSREIIKIITLYQPDSKQWVDYKVRRE